MRSQLSKGRSPEAWLITAEHQHGVILRQQLIGAGVSSSAIDRMVQSGRVVVLHRGVYRVAGHHPTWFSAVMAATLVGGPGAVASHRSAARLWRLQAGVHEVVEITTKRRISPTRIAVHRGTVERTETTTIDRIPVTGIHRTLIDLGDVADRQLVEDALDEALGRRLTSVAWLLKEITRLGTQGRRGAAILKTILHEANDHVPPSWLERRFIRLLSRTELADFTREQPACGKYFIDFAWPEVRLAVEVHGAKWHRRRWQADLARHNELAVAGWTVLHFTWNRIRDEPNAVLGEILAKYHELRWDLWRVDRA